jgi:hypothetical protein
VHSVRLLREERNKAQFNQACLFERLAHKHLEDRLNLQGSMPSSIVAGNRPSTP